MKLVDEAAFVSATKLARTNVVTASVDHIGFGHPVKIGSLLILKSQVNFVGRSSMEVGVLIQTEDVKACELHTVGSAYLTMVALDDMGQPTQVRKLVLETKEDKARNQRAQERRAERLQQRNSGR